MSRHYPTSRADRIAQDTARQKNAEFLAKKPPPQEQPMATDRDALRALFDEALAWGALEGRHYSESTFESARITKRNELADRASPSRAAWIDVAARLPEPGKAVLLDIGKKTPIRALWAAKATVEAGDDADDSWVEYDEASGTTYCPEGWYEWNEHEETHWAVSATPLRWMSIPVPAAVDVGAAAPKGGQDEFDAWRQS